MKLSVACNFDDALLPGLAPYPVYEVYGKLTSDYFGGGRPSFYLPQIGRPELARYVKLVHERGIEFNYLLNASAMDNREFTREGQRQMDELLAWLDEIGVDAVTVATVYLLRLIKRRHPRLRARVSSHRFTDNARKVRFWAEEGADTVVVSEVNIHRELKVLEAMQQAADGKVALSLIVNNWCRQDCAIAGNHAVTLSSASQRKSKGYPLDYCSVRCNNIRLNEPVNYVRANWIRPEDLHVYEALGFHNFKIVERNTPTPVLLTRVKAYAERRYDGNLLDLVQNYAYPVEAFGGKARDAYSYRRLIKYFAKPGGINLLRLPALIGFGKAASMLYPRTGPNPVQIDNRALDGFIERFKTQGCMELDCESCRYCHRWADKAVKIDPNWTEQMAPLYDELVDNLDSGAMWEPYTRTLRRLGRKLLDRVTTGGGPNA
ncbi:MAG: U32 family peptidase [Proteobacteria bacterium]|nr:U32 family peptidase [Pseudomonadota bacterium]